ncbi:hypothetical protein TNCV_3456591 [Trichonephila clavipes]|nr:hypothetical protein TNCV_3456591 [Trichonephila clavipes]
MLEIGDILQAIVHGNTRCHHQEKLYCSNIEKLDGSPKITRDVHRNELNSQTGGTKSESRDEYTNISSCFALVCEIPILDCLDPSPS